MTLSSTHLLQTEAASRPGAAAMGEPAHGEPSDTEKARGLLRGSKARVRDGKSETRSDLFLAFHIVTFPPLHLRGCAKPHWASLHGLERRGQVLRHPESASTARIMRRERSEARVLSHASVLRGRPAAAGCHRVSGVTPPALHVIVHFFSPAECRRYCHRLPRRSEVEKGAATGQRPAQLAQPGGGTVTEGRAAWSQSPPLRKSLHHPFSRPKAVY